MKKALLILLALSIVGAAAFADVKISAFTVTGLKATTGNDGTNAYNEIFAYDYLRGFSSLAVLGFSYSGSDPNYGYDARLLYIPNFGAAYTPMMDLSQVWVKMFDGMVTLTVGQVIPNSFATPEMEWGDSAFNGGGVNVTVKPIEGLELAYQLYLPIDGAAWAIADSFKNSKIGASYSMKDLFDIKGAYLMNGQEKAADAYAGFSLTAVPNLGLWVELLMVNIGDSGTGGTGETDIYVEANYPVIEGLTVGVAFEYNMMAADSSVNNWVVGPYVSYTLVEKVVLTGGADVGTGGFGWYGLQSGGAALQIIDKDAIAWDAYARVDFASPVGNIRVKAQYGAPDSKVSAANQFYVYAGFKWSL